MTFTRWSVIRNSVWPQNCLNEFCNRSKAIPKVLIYHFNLKNRMGQGMGCEKKACTYNYIPSLFLVGGDRDMVFLKTNM